MSWGSLVSHQVVKVVVLNSEPSKERMLLSFKLLSDGEPKKEHAGQGQKKGRGVTVGQVPGLLQQVILSDSGRGGPGPMEESDRSCWI